MSRRINECFFRAVAGGLGDFVVGPAIVGYYTPAQCTNPLVVDGAVYRWRAESDDRTQHELLEGIYDVATTKVFRTTILSSSNGGAKVNFTAAPRVRQVALAQDFAEVQPTGSLYAIQSQNPLGEFLGDDDFLWMPGSGMLNKRHAAIGNFAAIDHFTYAPGDVANTFDFPNPALLHLTGTNVESGLVITPTFNGGGGIGIDCEPAIPSTATASAFSAYGVYFNFANFGSGNITQMQGGNFTAFHAGAGVVTTLSGAVYQPGTFATVTNLEGWQSLPILQAGAVVTNVYGGRALRPFGVFGTSVTNVYGLYIADQSGIGSVESLNIKSLVGGNVFTGHSAMGNFAQIDHPTYAPGDPGPTFNFSTPVTLLINDKFVDTDGAGQFIWTNHKNTTVGKKNATGIDVEINLDSTSTGPWHHVIGVFFNATSNGPGNIDELAGGDFQAVHGGSGVCAGVIGALMQTTTVGPATTVVAGEYDHTQFSGAVDGRYGAFISTPGLFGGTIDKNYGLYVDNQGGIGTSQGYNIVSGRNGYLGTMDSKIGGNLFQGHTAMGNYADVDHLVYAPGDPTNAQTRRPFSVLGIDEFYSGDISGPSRNPLSLFMGLKHTGVSYAFAYGINENITINSDNTGPYGQIFGHSAFLVDYGSGDRTQIGGMTCELQVIGSSTQVSSWGGAFFNFDTGSGAKTLMWGGLFQVSASAAPITDLIAGEFSATISGTAAVTNYKGIHVSATNSASVTNAYGAYIEDHSTIGSSKSFNLYSKGLGSLDVHEGWVSIGQVGAVWPTVLYAAGTSYQGTYANYGYGLAITTAFDNGDLGGRVGNGLVLWPGFKLTSGNCGGATGIDLEPVYEATGGVAGGLTGIFLNPTFIGTVGASAVYGIVCNPVNYSSGNCAFGVTGIYGSAAHGGAGTCPSVIGLAYQVYKYGGAGAVTDMASIQLPANYINNTGGNVTNNYGILLEDQSGVGATGHNLNIYSKGGGNLFSGHMGVGGFAAIDRPTYAPGDPVNANPFSDSTVVLINELVVNQLQGTLLGLYGGYKNTTGSVNNMRGMDIQLTINSDSTGPLGFTNDGCLFNIINFGSGNINSLGAADYQLDHEGTGTIGLLQTASFTPFAFNGHVTTIRGIYVGAFTATGNNVTNGYQIYLDTFQGGDTYTNCYGLYIKDQSGVGTAESLNIKSVGAASMNLFEGHFGNGDGVSPAWASVTYGKGTALSGTVTNYHYISAAVGQITNAQMQSAHGVGALIWPSAKVTSAPSSGLIGLDVEPVLETSVNISGSLRGIYSSPYYAGTGNLNHVAGLVTDAYNYSSGNLSFIWGVEGTANHGGSGTVTEMDGLNFGCFAFTGAGVVTTMVGAKIGNYNQNTVTNAYGVWVLAHINAGGALTNNVGLLIEDQSGIGSTLNLNILSKGASSINQFEGSLILDHYEELTEMVAPAAPAANKVRVYAQDNGAGKTQLMALFSSGAAQQLAIQP